MQKVKDTLMEYFIEIIVVQPIHAGTQPHMLILIDGFHNFSFAEACAGLTQAPDMFSYFSDIIKF